MGGGDGDGGGSAETVDSRAVAVRAGQAVLAVVAAVVGAAVVAPACRSLALAAGFGPDSAAVAVAGTVGTAAGLAGAAVVFLAYAGDLDLLVPRVRVPTRREALLAVGGAVGLTVAGYAVVAAFAAAGLSPSTNRALANPPAYFLAMVPLSFLTVAVGEELVFRGVAQAELRRAVGPAGAIAGASLLFGLLHYVSGVGTPTQRLVYVATAAVLGAGLGYLYEETENLVVPVFVHGAYNAVQFAVQYVNVTG